MGTSIMSLTLGVPVKMEIGVTGSINLRCGRLSHTRDGGST